MKKGFVLGLALIFGIALVMGCATTKTKKVNEKEANEMTDDREIKMEITVNAETGEVTSVTSEYGKTETVSQEELQAIYQSAKGFRWVGLMLHTHSSPGCVYYLLGGHARKICF